MTDECKGQFCHHESHSVGGWLDDGCDACRAKEASLREQLAKALHDAKWYRVQGEDLRNSLQALYAENAILKQRLSAIEARSGEGRCAGLPSTSVPPSAPGSRLVLDDSQSQCIARALRVADCCQGSPIDFDGERVHFANCSVAAALAVVAGWGLSAAPGSRLEQCLDGK